MLKYKSNMTYNHLYNCIGLICLSNVELINVFNLNDARVINLHANLNPLSLNKNTNLNTLSQ